MKRMMAEPDKDADNVKLRSAFHGEGAYEAFKKIASEFYGDHAYRFLALELIGDPKPDSVEFEAEFWRVPRGAAAQLSSAKQTTLGGTYVSIEWFNAVKAELDALKAERAARLDRSRWKGCTHCENRCCCTCKYSTTPENRVPCRGCSVEETYESQDFCPNCGRPLTEEAWAEENKRWND